MDTDSKSATLRWWQSMMLSSAELTAKHIKPAPSAYKARLRRCETAEAAMLTDGFNALWFSLPEKVTNTDKPQDMLRWACIAVALSHVKSTTGKSIASEAGKNGDADKSIVSELRFSQLQNAKTPEEFLRRLRRVIQQLKGGVSPVSLAEDIYQWFAEHDQFRPRRADKRIAVRWAMEYYRAAGSTKN
mgnify:CR=1 FL=1